MAGIVKKLKVFGYYFTFVIRHRWEKYKDKSEKIMDEITMWRVYELGFWFRRYECVGKKNFHKSDLWKNHYVYEYMFGFNFIVAKTWITVQKGAMELGEK
jgi:hypothetical protein